jgi:hypothetical protein
MITPYPYKHTPGTVGAEIPKSLLQFRSRILMKELKKCNTPPLDIRGKLSRMPDRRRRGTAKSWRKARRTKACKPRRGDTAQPGAELRDR